MHGVHQECSHHSRQQREAPDLISNWPPFLDGCGLQAQLHAAAIPLDLERDAIISPHVQIVQLQKQQGAASAQTLARMIEGRHTLPSGLKIPSHSHKSHHCFLSDFGRRQAPSLHVIVERGNGEWNL